MSFSYYEFFFGRYRCIDDRSLCDGFFDCPGQEDENPEQCLFYKTVRNIINFQSKMFSDLIDTIQSLEMSYVILFMKKMT